MVRRISGRPSWLFILALVASLGFSVPAFAQSTGMVKGIVSDDKGQPVDGAKVTIEMTGGTGRGNFDGGRLAVVENRFGKGRTLLIGTNPSVAFYRTDGKANAAFFAELVKWSGRTRHVTLSNDAVYARVHKGEKGSFLWLVNPTRKAQTTTVSLADGKLSGGKPAWPVGYGYDLNRIEVPARDVLILPLA